jgi:hypothetical protein
MEVSVGSEPWSGLPPGVILIARYLGALSFVCPAERRPPHTTHHGFIVCAFAGVEPPLRRPAKAKITDRVSNQTASQGQDQRSTSPCGSRSSELAALGVA